ncbi:hypothetical protein [Modestobacter roseus]|uniref:hypothetical protein n=1 Tax=Modestobacter roseus TaxID=1181884 RepID=UPI0012953576|nr:hypothetical protein [Modestobacter roseus]MQA36104.1 hypothetical protein [Modestobacter roseus]
MLTTVDIPRVKRVGSRTGEVARAVTRVHVPDRVATARVELQPRTVAMDRWAGREHQIHCESHQQVPAALQREPSEAARRASTPAETRQRLHRRSAAHGHR